MNLKNRIGWKKNLLLTVLATGLLIITAIIAMMPFYFMFLSSLKPGTEIIRNGLTFQFDPGMSFDNYKTLLTYREGIYGKWYENSIIILILQTVVGLFFTSIVGYGLGMYKFKGRNAVFVVVLVLMMIPFEILLLPLYRVLISAHMTNSYFGIILPYLMPPFMVFFFRQYASGLPIELLEAGRIDGCTDYGIYFRIMVPIMIPAFGAMAILSAMNSWNNLLWPMIVLNKNDMFTIPIGMGTTITPYGNAYDILMSGAVMAVVPIIIIYLFCQKAFISGLTAGSVKG